MLLKNNFSLKTMNTFGLDVKADTLAIVQNDNDLRELFRNAFIDKAPLLILGGGSNILLTKDLPGLVLFNSIKGVEIIEEEDDFIYLEVGGGENWSDLVDLTVEKNWWGLENLSLIPGTMGAAPIQNIGAYGVELKDVMESLTAFDLSTGKIKVFKNTDCGFGYRTSVFKTSLKGKYFILGVVLKLSKIPKLNLSYSPLKSAFEKMPVSDISIRMVSDAVKNIRRSKLPDPKLLGNAGSFFKNPVVSASKVDELKIKYPEIPFYRVDDDHVKLAAGWLIEKCGWKGKRIGDAGVHEKQALVLVNYGGANSQEIVSLAEKIQESVKATFGISLEAEVTII